MNTNTYFVCNCHVLAFFTFYALPSGGKLKGAMVHCKNKFSFALFILFWHFINTTAYYLGWNNNSPILKNSIYQWIMKIFIAKPMLLWMIDRIWKQILWRWKPRLCQLFLNRLKVLFLSVANVRKVWAHFTSHTITNLFGKPFTKLKTCAFPSLHYLLQSGKV